MGEKGEIASGRTRFAFKVPGIFFWEFVSEQPMIVRCEEVIEKVVRILRVIEFAREIDRHVNVFGKTGTRVIARQGLYPKIVVRDNTLGNKFRLVGDTNDLPDVR